MTGISCIIPAWNEAARIGPVVALAAAHPLIDEVIVVDDASHDETAAIAGAVPGVRVIRQDRNGGKTRAVATGVAAARGRRILLIDADLQGLTAEALTALIRPVLQDGAAAALSLRGNAPGLWRMIGLDYISGERLVPRALLLGLEPPARFGLEVAMNRRLIASGARLAVVHWPGVRSPLKSEKMGLWRGIAADIRMMRDIFRTIGPLEALHQIRTMRRLAG